jgi:histone-lysine N-methyltransferase SETD3
VKWLSDGGAEFDKIKMRYYSEGYRGVHARARIRKNENFLYIPKNLLITLEMSKEAPVGARMEKLKLSLLSPKHSYLTSYVLQELHNKDTKWQPYLDLLPKDLSSFPISFTHEEKKWLEGSPFLDQVEDKIKDMGKDYDTIVEAVPEFRKYSLEEFKRVRMLVSSRIFGVMIKGVKTDALVPLADMLNHKRPQETSWEYSDKKEGFIIEAKVTIERGNQVYDSYGKKCNSRYFLNYGFTVENNDANEVPIKISLDEEDKLYSVKKKILGNNKSKTIRVSEDLTEKNMVHFFSFLRFINFKGDPMTLYKFQIMEGSSKKADEDNEENYFQCTNIPPISIENETQCLNQIKDQCKVQLNEYPTTYEEDLKLLETNKDLTYNQRNCVIMRSSEKHVFSYVER